MGAYHRYEPSEGERNRHPKRDYMMLWRKPVFDREPHRAHSKSQASGKATVELVPYGDGSPGWLARISGVNEEWLPERSFLKGSWDAGEDWQTDRRLVFSNIGAGIYEVEAYFTPPHVEEAGKYRFYFTFHPDDGLQLLDHGRFEERMRGEVEVSFGDVRSLVAQQKWHVAERAAGWLSELGEREKAMEYIASTRAQYERKLPDLKGSEKQCKWASDLRKTALTSLTESSRQRDAGASEAAYEWLSSHDAARFWIDLRDHVRDGGHLWEMFLNAHVEEE